MKVEIEIDVPEGLEFVGYRRACEGEFYFSSKGVVECWDSSWGSSCMYPIFRKKPRQPTAADVGKRVKTIGMALRGELICIYGDYAWLLPHGGSLPVTKSLDVVVLEEIDE